MTNALKIQVTGVKSATIFPQSFSEELTSEICKFHRLIQFEKSTAPVICKEKVNKT